MKSIRGMKKTVFIILGFLCVTYGTSQNTITDSLRTQFERDAQRLIGEFDQYSQKAREDYEKYEAQARADYFQYVKSIQSVWGTDTLVDNTRTEWVEYADNFRSRSVVDFEHGDISVEIALDEVESMDTLLVTNKLAAAIENMLNSRGTTCSYSSSVDISEPLTAKPILEGLIDYSPYLEDEMMDSVQGNRIVSARPLPPKPTIRGKELIIAQHAEEKIANDTIKSNVNQQQGSLSERRGMARERAKQKLESISGKIPTGLLAKRIAKSSKRNETQVKGKDGKNRKVVRVQMSLVTDNLTRNAALYKDLVAEFSQKYQIEQPLIYAVMEQESYFNPEATSWVPAYGLMQLVPWSGGKDAYRFVYKKEWVPTRSYLYNPRNNIELGTAYLRVLMNQFASIEDPHCRRLCVTASYNTGAGNVSRSFVGTTNLNNALPLINKYDYNQLYNHLTTKLAYEEARNYVAGVTKRREKYLK